MLLVGTRGGLQDVDSGRELAKGPAVTALAPGPSGRWYALFDRRSVALVQAGGTGIEPVGELPEPDGQSLSVLADGTIAVGRTGARVVTLGPNGEVRDSTAFQAVPGRDSWENPAAPTPDTRTMACAGHRWWVNVHVGGVWWSEDAGQTWHQAVQPEADVHEVRASAGGQVAVAAAVGFGWSEDGGGSWSWTTGGLGAHYLRAAALDEGVAFVSASDGPFTNSGAVYRSALGSSFVRCEAGLPARFAGNVDSGHLDAAGGRAAIGFGDRVYTSEDRGQTWQVAAVLAGPVTAVRFAPG